MLFCYSEFILNTLKSSSKLLTVKYENEKIFEETCMTLSDILFENEMINTLENEQTRFRCLFS